MSAPSSHAQHPVKGALLATLTFFTTAAVGVGVKSMGISLNTWTILFFQYTVCLLLLTPTAIKQKSISNLYRSPCVLLLVLRGLAGVMSYFFAFLAMQHISLVSSILLWNTAPLWVPFIVFICFRTKLPWYTIFAAMIGFIGIVFVLHPNTDINALGSVYALIAGILYAITMVINRELSQTESHQTILAYYFTISMIVSLPFMLIHLTSLSLRTFCILILIGLGTYIGQYHFTRASKIASPGILAPLAYTAIIFSALFDWYFWNLIPHWYTWLGSLLIMFSSMINVILSQRKNSQPLN